MGGLSQTCEAARLFETAIFCRIIVLRYRVLTKSLLQEILGEHFSEQVPSKSRLLTKSLLQGVSGEHFSEQVPSKPRLLTKSLLQGVSGEHFSEQS